MLKLKRLCCLVLAAVLLISSAPMVCADAIPSLEHEHQNSFETEWSGADYACSCSGCIVGEYEPETPTEDDLVNNKKDIATLSADDLPSSVDNSDSPYFPEIGDQGNQGSCVAFSSVYYQFTYEMNRARQVATTPDNTFSTSFVYNLANLGYDSGLEQHQAYEVLQKVGCPTAKTYPYDDSDCLRWPDEEAIWREAMRYRIKSYRTFNQLGEEDSMITSPDDSDLLPIKTALSNGEILRFGAFPSGWKGYYVTDENDENYADMIAEWSEPTFVGHSMVLVGYDDNIWCDINRNEEVDEGEMGAFKAANSHGRDSFNDGFIWIAYDALNKKSTVEGVGEQKNRIPIMNQIHGIEVAEPDEGKEIYVKFTLNSVDRTDITVDFSAYKSGRFYKDEFLSDIITRDSTNMYAFDGTRTPSDATFAYSLSDLVGFDVNSESFESFEFNIDISDSKGISSYYGSSPTIIKDISIVDEYEGTQCSISDEFPVSINGVYRGFGTYDRDTYSSIIRKTATIRYVGFDKPTLHYQLGNRGFKEVAMQESDEYKGYMYEYFINDLSDGATFYFSDENGNIDDNNGEYYTAKAGVNYCYTDEQIEKLRVNDFDFVNEILDVDTSMPVEFDIDAEKGYAPYKCKYTIENLNTGETEVFDYNYDFIKKPYYIAEEGRYRITVEVMDNAQNTATLSKEYELKNQPFEIASITQDKIKGVVSEPIVFTSTTAFEKISTAPKRASYFTIKDSNAKTVWQKTAISEQFSENQATSTTYMTYFPTKAGEYTLTVRLTDFNDEEAEKTITFSVSNKMIGDSDCDGDITIMDATLIQRYLAQDISDDKFHEDMSDCDKDSSINITDATYVQMYLAQKKNCCNVGEIIEYVPKTYTITFINTIGWENVNCEIISPYTDEYERYPGKPMTLVGEDENGISIYTVEVTEYATQLAFNCGLNTNMISETLRIDYDGGDKTCTPVNNDIGTLFEVIVT